MDEEKTVLATVDDEFVDDGISSTEIPTLTNPDDREYENVEIEQEGGK